MDLNHFATLVRNRRTVKTFTGEAISRQRIDAILELARWAPTHRMHQPWRFVVLDQAVIANLLAFLDATPHILAFPDPAKGAAKYASLKERLSRVAVMIHATWLRHENPEVDAEDHAAAAAAVQNILLGASADGIASFWSSSLAMQHADVMRWLGIDPERESFLGSLWLGIATETPPAPPRLDLDGYRTWR